MRLFPRLLVCTAIAAAAPDEFVTYVEALAALACDPVSLTILSSTAEEDGSTVGAMLLLGYLRSGRLPKSFSKSLLEVKIDLGSEVMKEEIELFPGLCTTHDVDSCSSAFTLQPVFPKCAGKRRESERWKTMNIWCPGSPLNGLAPIADVGRLE